MHSNNLFNQKHNQTSEIMFEDLSISYITAIRTIQIHDVTKFKIVSIRTKTLVKNRKQKAKRKNTRGLIAKFSQLCLCSN
jgi:hypothetical protein